MATSNPKSPLENVASRPTKHRSLWESYAVLPAKTRLKISLAVTAIALGGMYLSNRLEEAIPSSEAEKSRLPGHKPSSV